MLRILLGLALVVVAVGLAVGCDDDDDPGIDVEAACGDLCFCYGDVVDQEECIADCATTLRIAYPDCQRAFADWTACQRDAGCGAVCLDEAALAEDLC